MKKRGFSPGTPPTRNIGSGGLGMGLGMALCMGVCYRVSFVFSSLGHISPTKLKEKKTEVNCVLLLLTQFSRKCRNFKLKIEPAILEFPGMITPPQNCSKLHGGGVTYTVEQESRFYLHDCGSSTA